MKKNSKSISKPQEFWNAFKSLGILKKPLDSKVNAVDNSNSLTYDIAVSKVFINFFSISAECFLIKLRDPPNKYNLKSVFNNYSNFVIPDVFHKKNTLKEKVFKIMEIMRFPKLQAQVTSVEDF